MRGLKFIPYFLGFAVVSFLGMLFVQTNDEKVVVNLGNYQTPEYPLGFVLICAVLLGMVVIGVVCILELSLLMYQNRNLKKKVSNLEVPPDDTLSTKFLSSFEPRWPKKKRAEKTTTPEKPKIPPPEKELELEIPTKTDPPANTDIKTLPKEEKPKTP